MSFIYLGAGRAFQNSVEHGKPVGGLTSGPLLTSFLNLRFKSETLHLSSVFKIISFHIVSSQSVLSFVIWSILKLTGFGIIIWTLKIKTLGYPEEKGLLLCEIVGTLLHQFWWSQIPRDVFRSLELGIKPQSSVGPWRKHNANEPCKVAQLCVAGPAACSRGS